MHGKKRCGFCCPIRVALLIFDNLPMDRALLESKLSLKQKHQDSTILDFKVVKKQNPETMAHPSMWNPRIRNRAKCFRINILTCVNPEFWASLLRDVEKGEVTCTNQNPFWTSLIFPKWPSLHPITFPDAPQVQCVKSYKAREHDELTLEKADIIMVLRQSSDGELTHMGLWL